MDATETVKIISFVCNAYKVPLNQTVLGVSVKRQDPYENLKKI